jgi:DNA-binding transcriptional LysR family regulator
MDRRQLAAFVAVAEELNFGRAGRRLGVKQPAMSQVIRRLESELDLVLFERTSHRVALTAAGATLLPYARAALDAYSELRTAAAGVRAGTGGRLRVGTSEGTLPALNVILEALAEARDGVEIELETFGTRERLDRVRSGDLDVAFVFDSPADEAGVTVLPLYEEALAVVMPESHEAARAAAVEVAALRELPLMLRAGTSRSNVRARLLDYCRRAGFEPTPGPPFGSLENAFALIAAGRAWTLLRRSVAHQHVSGVAVRELREPVAMRLDLVSRATGMTQAAAAFVALARELRDTGRFRAVAGP